MENTELIKLIITKIIPIIWNFLFVKERKTPHKSNNIPYIIVLLPIRVRPKQEIIITPKIYNINTIFSINIKKLFNISTSPYN